MAEDSRLQTFWKKSPIPDSMSGLTAAYKKNWNFFVKSIVKMSVEIIENAQNKQKTKVFAFKQPKKLPMVSIGKI